MEYEVAYSNESGEDEASDSVSSNGGEDRLECALDDDGHVICAICRDGLHDESMPCMTLECGHTFHASCACHWFRQGNPACPLCRDNPVLDPMSAVRRSSVVRRYANTRRAPAGLKRKVDTLRRAETKRTTLSRELKELRRSHKEVLVKVNMLRGRLHTCDRRVWQLKADVGLFHCPDVPMPPLRVR